MRIPYHYFLGRGVLSAMCISVHSQFQKKKVSEGQGEHSRRHTHTMKNDNSAAGMTKDLQALLNGTFASVAGYSQSNAIAHC